MLISWFVLHVSEPRTWHTGLISPSFVTIFHAVLPVLPKLGPQTSSLWWCALFDEPPAMLLACCIPATVLWDGVGDVMPCVAYPAFPGWCDGRNAQRVPRGPLNRQRLKSHYHSLSSWLCQILAISRESFIFCVPLKNVLESIFLGMERSDAWPATKTVIIYG